MIVLFTEIEFLIEISKLTVGKNKTIFQWTFLLQYISLEYHINYCIYFRQYQRILISISASTLNGAVNDPRSPTTELRCHSDDLSRSKILRTNIDIKTTSYWHHVSRSDVMSDGRTWCQYDVVLTHLLAKLDLPIRSRTKWKSHK